MDTAATGHFATSPSAIRTQPRTIDCRWLLALYAVVPLSLLIAAADILLLDSRLRHDVLPYSPDRWPLWSVVFGLPHIVASLVTMADREYLAHYRHSLLWPLVIAATGSSICVLGPQPIGQQALFIFLAFYTIYHVLSQQLGITLVMMGTPPTRAFHAWKWLSIFSGFAIFTLVFGHAYGLRHVMLGSFRLYDLLEVMAGVLMALTFAFALRLTPRSRNRLGTWYLWGNVALLATAFLTLELQYTVFTILMPRVIHDLTAFTVYITHDMNRNAEQPRNLVYRLARFTRLPPLVLLPVLAIGIAYFITTSLHIAAVSVLMFTITLLHYYFEGFIWRGPNPHRQQISFRR